MNNHQDTLGEQLELEAKIEELRLSQEELKESRNKYSFLYEYAPVGYFTFNQKGDICSVNMTGAKMLGLERSELVDQKFESFVCTEGRRVFVEFIQTVFASRNKETCRLGLAGETPEQRFVRIEGLVVESGEECLAVLVDITEKKRAEQLLSDSEYDLKKAQSMTHVGSWRFDPATGVILSSSELLEIMRLSHEQSTQDDFARVVHPEDYDRVMGHLRLGIENGKSYEIEHRLQFSDGTERWVFSIVEPIVSSAGKVIRIYGTTQDITARKRVELELQNKTNELQTIFNSISDGLIVYDSEGKVQHRNLIGPRYFPVESEQGQSCREIFHPHDSPDSEECPVERALKGERIDTSLRWDVEGQARYMDVTATPIHDALNAKNRALVFFRDVSEKKRQEMHLIQSEKMSSIGVLATGMAHEINNPLTSVAGFAEGLQRRFRDDPSLSEDSRLVDFPHYLDVIVRESYRCKGIIDHLLSFGRKSDDSFSLVDVNSMLEEILELLRYLPGYQNVQVVTTLKRDLPQIFADPSGLRQVCMNLLVNAHEATEKSGLVQVATRQVGAATVVIDIRDNGYGMSQPILKQIWEPFFTTKDVGKGVGLGLALTYNIVKRHCGEIKVQSRVGEGSVFEVHLPVRPERRVE